MRRTVALCAVLLTMLVLASPAGAQTRPVDCGTISGRVHLEEDLACDEIHVAARAVVDLAGHTLTATTVTVDRATIRGGTLGCEGGTITVTDSRFQLAGIVGRECAMTIVGNRMAGDRTLAGVAEELAVDLPIVVAGNDIAGYGIGVNAVGVPAVDPHDLTDLTVTGNRIHSNIIGAEVNCGGACLIDGNQFSRNHHGLIGYGTGVYTVTNNRFRFNEDLPMSIDGTVIASGNQLYGNGRPCLPTAC